MSIVSLEKLSLDLGRVQDNSEAADIAFEANGVTYRAHTAILRERCPRLLAFGSTAKKPRNCWCRHDRPQLVKLPHNIAEILPDLLDYAYTGKIARIEAVGHLILKLAYDWDLEELKETCEQSLCLNLCLENCIDMFILGHDNNCFNLRAKAKAMVIENIQNLLDSDSFVLLYQRLDLLKEIIRGIGHRKNGDSNDKVSTSGTLVKNVVIIKNDVEQKIG